jgi:acetoin utilization protein AcuB
MKNRLVKDWMTHDVITINPDTTLPDASALMRAHHIRRLPVVDRDGSLLGILSQSDVFQAEPSDVTSLDIWEINYLLSRLRIEKVMTPNPLSVRPETTLKEATQIMFDNKIGGLPVVDNANKVIGIITESDIFRILIAWFNEEAKDELPAGSA